MLRLEPRPAPSRAWAWASPLLALAITVLLGVLLFVTLGKNPVRGLRCSFGSSLSRPVFWASWA